MRHFLAVGLALAALVARAADVPPLPYQATAQHVGVVNCASSLCHGSISEWKGSNVLQNEYVTWSRVDKHALRASQVLWNDRSKRIAANLGLKQPAHEPGSASTATDTTRRRSCAASASRPPTG